MKTIIVKDILKKFSRNGSIDKRQIVPALFFLGAMFLLVLLRCGRLAQVRRQGMILMVLLSIYQGYTSINVDNAAHIAGLCGGILLGGIYYFSRIYRR